MFVKDEAGILFCYPYAKLPNCNLAEIDCWLHLFW